MRRPWSLIASVRARVARNSVARWARLARIKPRSESFRVSSSHDCVHRDDTAMSFARRCSVFVFVNIDVGIQVVAAHGHVALN
jgi:hypothetical protein